MKSRSSLDGGARRPNLMSPLLPMGCASRGHEPVEGSDLARTRRVKRVGPVFRLRVTRRSRPFPLHDEPAERELLVEPIGGTQTEQHREVGEQQQSFATRCEVLGQSFE